jgi:hypothetical protein
MNVERGTLVPSSGAVSAPGGTRCLSAVRALIVDPINPG